MGNNLFPTIFKVPTKSYFATWHRKLALFRDIHCKLMSITIVGRLNHSKAKYFPFHKILGFIILFKRMLQNICKSVLINVLYN